MAQPQQNPLSALGIGTQPGQSPMNMSPDQYQFQQGMSQLQALTPIIQQKHQELVGLIDHHQNIRNQLGV